MSAETGLELLVAGSDVRVVLRDGTVIHACVLQLPEGRVRLSPWGLSGGGTMTFPLSSILRVESLALSRAEVLKVANAQRDRWGAVGPTRRKTQPTTAVRK